MCCSAARCRATTYKGAGIPIYKPFPKMEAGSTKVLLRLRLTSVLNFPFLKWISWRGAVLGCIPHPRARLSKQKQLQCWAHFDGCAGYGRPLRRALMDQPSAAVLRHGGGLGARELRSMLPLASWRPDRPSQRGEKNAAPFPEDSMHIAAHLPSSGNANRDVC
jgi:hypothetical protein